MKVEGVVVEYDDLQPAIQMAGCWMAVERGERFIPIGRGTYARVGSLIRRVAVPCTLLPDRLLATVPVASDARVRMATVRDEFDALKHFLERAGWELITAQQKGVTFKGYFERDAYSSDYDFVFVSLSETKAGVQRKMAYGGYNGELAARLLCTQIMDAMDEDEDD